MNDLILSGLDGSNPLAFLAALGLIRAVGDREARLDWQLQGRWRPRLRSPLGREALLDHLDQDRASWATDPALSLSYSKAKGDAEGVVRDLKPPPGGFRAWLLELLGEVERPPGRSIELAACFATDVATDNNGNTKPSALHFTAGQQQFLLMARQLVTQVTRADLEEALFGPWMYQRELPVLGWDGSASRDYALRASDPSKDKKTGVPGADWLALRGLSLLPVAPRGESIVTTGVVGEWKTGRFIWPIWTVPAGADTIRSLLTLPALVEDRSGRAGLAPDQRRAMGIAAVFESSIRRSDQGGYGSFSPARVR